MKKRWIAVLGALLIGTVIGCDQGQKVTVPDTVPPPPPEGPTLGPGGVPASPLANPDAQQQP